MSANVKMHQGSDGCLSGLGLLNQFTSFGPLQPSHVDHHLKVLESNPAVIICKGTEDAAESCFMCLCTSNCLGSIKLSTIKAFHHITQLIILRKIVWTNLEHYFRYFQTLSGGKL